MQFFCIKKFKVMRSFILPIFIILTLLFSCNKDESGFQANNYGNIEGVIYNEFGQPLEGAKIKIESDSTLSDNLGKYKIEKILVKDYTVSISKETYLTHYEDISIIDGENIEKDFILSVGEEFLNISDSTLTVSKLSGSITIDVISNSSWVISNKSTWVNCSASGGKGSGNVVLSWAENVNSSDRMDSIQFQTGTITQKIKILQKSPVQLIKYEGIIGNGVTDVKDSVYILFNKSVQVEKIISGWEYCISDIKYNSVDNGKGVKFTYPCAELGGVYPFTIKVKDEMNNISTFDVIIPFYKSKLTLDGSIKEYILINNDKEILISTSQPNMIYKYSIEKDSILKTIDLSNTIVPHNIALNHYNGKLYIAGSSNNLYALDINSFSINEVPIDRSNDSDYYYYPGGILFTSSGFGIMHNGSKWRIIDARDENKIKIIRCKDCVISENSHISRLHLNYDKSKIYIVQSYGSCEFGILNGFTQEVSTLLSPIITRTGDLTPNRLSEKVFVSQKFAQFIMDIDGEMISEQSYGPYGYIADFSYKQNENNIIYAIDGDFFKVLNYNTSNTMMWCDILHDLSGLSSTIDGKRVICHKKNNNLTSSLYTFETSYFYMNIE